MSFYDAPLHFGSEAGVHFGKNAIFIIGHYDYGTHDIEKNLPGNVFTRSYGAALQLRRMIF